MGLSPGYNLVEELQVNVSVLERSALDVERSIWLKVKEVEWLACEPHTKRFLLVWALPKKEGVGRVGWGDQIDQRFLLPKPKKHGKPNLRFCNTSPSSPKHIFQSPHYRTCQCWQDIHLAENMRHYGESSLPENIQREQGVRGKGGKYSNLFVAIPLVSLSPRLNSTHPWTLVTPVLRFSRS